MQIRVPWSEKSKISEKSIILHFKLCEKTWKYCIMTQIETVNLQETILFSLQSFLKYIYSI